jgi:hypothetical protein
LTPSKSKKKLAGDYNRKSTDPTRKTPGNLAKLALLAPHSLLLAAFAYMGAQTGYIKWYRE